MSTANSRRLTGSIILFIAAILFSTYHLCISILGAGKLSPFKSSDLSLLYDSSIVFGLIGIGYLIYSEIMEYNNSEKQDER
ncbi:hypothetical protein [Paenibacillus sp. 481]|uniref:hypothetical protein n=1 Tax=Paenibacillus sp. 481 TaxID=2835869 RepID=UPI001E631FA1|nr:hypothetical protein [Paenibacillus sp. 481]UHA72671.1 hypothetical protein KIK04_18785 [Paenibacillus sp. 481]